ncbi:aldehyde dehydrogenase [Clostridium paraputrificum]|uniref:aldehyde dehydrogenase n=1 Tax=Clostridium TaxID=1485 RepID=UPI003D33114D
MMGMKEILQSQKTYFKGNSTLSIDFRINNLRKLKRILKENEDEILEALNKDLGKSHFEGYATELGIVYEEINLAVKNVRKWARRERVKSSIIYYPSKSYIYKEPYGVALIIGPFNYPFQLVISPLIGAISAGNCAIIKPSEHSIETSRILEKIINSNFEESFLKVVEPSGGKELVSELLDLDFDYIFFTGSVKVGKIVMEMAAKRLTPITLELGGKSPCIVDKDADIKKSAKRIVWGKFLNAGQTCVAPDYMYVHSDIKEKLLSEMVKEIKIQFGVNHIESSDFPRIISEREIDRISSYIKDGDVYYGGEIIKEGRYISPTLLINIKEGSRIEEEEIFGPILPIYEFRNLDEVLCKINSGEKPLALYYFSEDDEKVEKVLKESTSGGVTINDTIIHVASSHLPFGGVGNSGIGEYHGKASFDTFSHRKSVLKRGTFMEFPFRFPPYKNRIKLLKKIMK